VKPITFHKRVWREPLDNREHGTVIAVGNLIFVPLARHGPDAATIVRPRVWAGHRLHAGDDQQRRKGSDATMEPLAFGRPPATPEIGEGTTEALPPGTARVENLLETVGIVIFLALLVGAAVILIRRNRNR
jgi:hypothetical protein